MQGKNDIEKRIIQKRNLQRKETTQKERMERNKDNMIEGVIRRRDQKEITIQGRELHRRMNYIEERITWKKKLHGRRNQIGEGITQGKELYRRRTIQKEEN